MSFPRVDFWNSLTHRPIQNLLSQTRVNRVNFKITKFPRQTLSQHFPLRNLHTLLFFPRKQPILTDPRFHHYFPSRFLIIVLFLREIESSPISSQLRQLLIYPTGNRSFCRNGFHPPSIFVSFRLIDLSLRIFVSPVRCRSPGREAGGGRRGLWARIDKRSTLFRFLSRFTR